MAVQNDLVTSAAVELPWELGFPSRVGSVWVMPVWSWDRLSLPWCAH